MIFLFSRSNKLFKCGIGTMIYNIGFRKDFERMRVHAYAMCEKNVNHTHTHTHTYTARPVGEWSTSPHLEPSPFCDESMELDELLSRKKFFEDSIRSYYMNVDNTETVCAGDPQKFHKLKAYQERRLLDTLDHIEKYMEKKSRRIESVFDVLEQLIY